MPPNENANDSQSKFKLTVGCGSSETGFWDVLFFKDISGHREALQSIFSMRTRRRGYPKWYNRSSMEWDAEKGTIKVQEYWSETAKGKKTSGDYRCKVTLNMRLFDVIHHGQCALGEDFGNYGLDYTILLRLKAGQQWPKVEIEDRTVGDMVLENVNWVEVNSVQINIPTWQTTPFSPEVVGRCLFIDFLDEIDQYKTGTIECFEKYEAEFNQILADEGKRKAAKDFFDMLEIQQVEGTHTREGWLDILVAATDDARDFLSSPEVTTIREFVRYKVLLGR